MLQNIFSYLVILSYPMKSNVFFLLKFSKKSLESFQDVNWSEYVLIDEFFLLFKTG